MTELRLLQVNVNDELVLDAGICEEIAEPKGLGYLIRPPKTTLFHQVLAYLDQKPDPDKPPPGRMVGREGVAAAAICLRWGSYLAVLLDNGKPLWSEVRSPKVSRISDEEMARINIEASAAAAEWIDLYRCDPTGSRYQQLVNRAVAYLPMPKKISKLKVTEFAALSTPETAVQVVQVQAADSSRLARVRGNIELHPSRVLSNALLNCAWRNGPVEDIHAGGFRGYPIDRRRVSPAEERELMVFASERLALGMTVCRRFAMERPVRPWPEQVLPYGLAEFLLITPSGWTLTETSREVRLDPWPTR